MKSCANRGTILAILWGVFICMSSIDYRNGSMRRSSCENGVEYTQREIRCVEARRICWQSGRL